MPLEIGRFYCLDGGFGSHLPNHFKSSIESDPLWSAKALHEDREAVIRTHRDFLRAGADIITTNTYQASAQLLAKHILDFEDPIHGPELLLQDAIKMASEAVAREREIGKDQSRTALIAASVGPYGACLGDGSEYNGSYIDRDTSIPVSRRELRDWHLERLQHFVRGGNNTIDIFAAETIPSVVEAMAILDALEHLPGAQCWISFSCKDGTRTARGEPLDEVFNTLVSHPSFCTTLFAVGVNCVDPKDVTSQLERFNTVNRPRLWRGGSLYSKVPYVVYPNSGSFKDWDPEKKCWAQDGDSTVIFDHLEEWMCLGANIVGGCCRVTPNDIRKIKSVMTSSIPEVLTYRKTHSEVI